MDELNKIYVEPTNRCNLTCVTCILHSYRCFIRSREKYFRRSEFGRLSEQTLRAVWSNPEYATFRDRVRAFDFPPLYGLRGMRHGGDKRGGLLRQSVPRLRRLPLGERRSALCIRSWGRFAFCGLFQECGCLPRRAGPKRKEELDF